MTRTFNWKIIFSTLGALLILEALFMAMPALVAYHYGEYDFWAFVNSTILTFASGLLLLVMGNRAPRKVGEREGYFIVAIIWVLFSIFGMLPFLMSGEIASVTDAWFETVAGFSTTGATIVSDVEAMTHGCLFWRALMQWLGGCGIIVLSVAILPMFGLGGMQLYAAEVTGVSYEKLSPRIADTAKRVWGMYILLTCVEAVILCLFDMEPFDSICHSMSTIATGGFSTKNLSIIEYGRGVQWTIAIFMFLSGINFAYLIYAIMGKPGKLFKDEETRWYAGAVGICTIVLAIGLCIHYGTIVADSPANLITSFFYTTERALRKSFFMVCSAMTSTGFAASDYMTWPHLFWVMVFFMMFTGGAAGSTAGGIKWVRLAIMAKNAFAECKRRIHPNAIIPVKLNGKVLPQSTINNVMAFMMIYVIILVLTVLIFCASGVVFDEAIGTAVSAIGNVGVSIGQFGPSGSYEFFPTVAKWWMTVVMVIGRLELFTIILLFSPSLWKR